MNINNKLNKSSNYLIYFCIFIYSSIFISEKFKILLSNNSKTYLLIFIYLFETFIAYYYKKTTLYNWKLKDYLQHHLIGSIFILFGYNLTNINYFKNMIRYIYLMNINEITILLQNFNLNHRILFINTVLALYYCIHLIFYELKESYIYYNLKHTKHKFIVLFPIIFSYYHLFIISPFFIKKLLYIIKKIK